MITKKVGLAQRLAVLTGLVVAIASVLLLMQGTGKATAATTPLKLPWAAGTSYSVSQTWNAGYHTGINAYAYDFAMPKGAAVLASATGTVTKAAKSNTSGQCGGVLNEVHITHADGSRTVYMHLNDVTVSLNQKVGQAQLIGHVGCTGQAYGAHLHFQSNTGSGWGQPTKFYFAEYPGQQLRVGQRVTSQNTSTGGGAGGSGSDHFYTTNVAEPANAMASGYRWEGIAAYISPGPISGWVPLYRLWSGSGSDHFYTTNASERDSAVTRSGYGYEGVAGYVSPTPGTGLVALYRLWNGSAGDHFYTTSAAERDAAVARSGYVYEGVAAYVSAGAASGLVPFFRWWLP